MDRIESLHQKRRRDLEDNPPRSTKAFRLTTEAHAQPEEGPKIVANQFSDVSLATIMDLPQEMVDHIASFLGPSDVVAVSLASKKLSNAFAAARWSTVRIANHSQEQICWSIQKFIARYLYANVTGIQAHNMAYLRNAELVMPFLSRHAERSRKLPFHIHSFLTALKALRHLTLDVGGLSVPQVKELAERITSGKPGSDDFEFANLRSIRVLPVGSEIRAHKRNIHRLQAVTKLCLALNSRTSSLQVWDTPKDFTPLSEAIGSKQHLRRLYASYAWNAKALIGPAELAKTISEHHKDLEWLHVTEELPCHDSQKWNRIKRSAPQADLLNALNEFASTLNTMPKLRRLCINIDQGTLSKIGNPSISMGPARDGDAFFFFAEQVGQEAPHLTHISVSNVSRAAHKNACIVATRQAGGSLKTEFFRAVPEALSTLRRTKALVAGLYNNVQWGCRHASIGRTHHCSTWPNCSNPNPARDEDILDHGKCVNGPGICGWVQPTTGWKCCRCQNSNASYISWCQGFVTNSRNQLVTCNHLRTWCGSCVTEE
ncbi:hypothetical protein QBC44DRAFT_308600 [Cladorrhinum sp. PSN332]|nr:hypothetical protein QBC44DRAFT_308600 [Cladorrhinum sp. PSN332]